MDMVFATYTAAEAHLLKGLLESEGITAEVRDELLAGILGDIPLLQNRPSVWVAEGDAARASEIVREFQRGRVEAGEAWRCACGETLDAQFTACWRCSRSRAEEPHP
jgi:hypothetical protein